MNTAKVKGRAIFALGKILISAMPKNIFTTEKNADEFMLKGDEFFSENFGEYFTCGFSKVDLTPDDVTEKKYYIAGYNSNNPAEKVLDSMYARAMYIDDNTDRGGVVICSIDVVGMSRKDINDIRKKVIESGRISSVKSINICCTHTHSAIDTQGLWGEKVTKTGRDESFMETLKNRVAKSIEEAYFNRKNGELFYSFTETENLQFDCRTPDTYDKNITSIRFVPFEGDGEIFFVNFAAHAELMGSGTKSVSADFPCYMIREIEEKNKGASALFVNGAIGGMISAKEIKKVYRNEIDCEEYTKTFGKKLGEMINSLSYERKLKPIINVKSAPVKIKAENFVLILARMLKVINNDIGRDKKSKDAFVYSEVGYLELGDKDIGMFLISGELFPELFTGDFLTAETSASGKKANYNPLKNVGDAKHKFVVGLCNDELGYIIPENDFYLNEETPYINNSYDKFDRKHYEETNSTGPKTAETILNEIEKLVESVR